MKRNVLKKSYLVSLLLVLISICLLVGTSFAWFTDSVSNTGNRIQAGNLKIDLLMYDGTDYTSIANGEGDIFDEASKAQNANETLWEPGKTQVACLAVRNKGNLAVKYNIYVDVTDEGLVGALEYAIIPMGKNENIAKLSAGSFATTFDSWSDLTATYTPADLVEGRTKAAENGCLDEIINGTQDETDYFAIVVHMKETAGNEYKNKNAIIDVTIVATQATAEEDGFDSDQYDKDAIYPTLAEPVHESKKYSGNFAQNKVATATGDSTQVTATQDIKTDEGSASTLIPEGTTLFKKDISGSDVPITTEQTEEFNGEIVSKIDSKSGIEVDSITYQISYTYKEGDSETPVSKFSNIVTNRFNVSKGLKNVNVYTTHNGGAETELKDASKLNPAETNLSSSHTDGSFYYDSENGELYIYSSTYSEFRVTYESNFVAAIDCQGYASLADAISAAVSGQTVKLLRDTNETKKINSVSNIIVDGQGYRAIFAENVSPFGTVNNSTFKNIEFEVDVPDSDVCLCDRIKGCQFLNVDLFGSGSVTGNVGAFCWQISGTNTFKDCDVYTIMTGGGHANNYNSAFFGIPQGGAVINMTDCTFSGVLKCGSAAMFVANPCYNAATLNIKNVKNNGLIQATCYKNNSLFTMPNQFVAVTTDGTFSFTDVTLDGTKLSYPDMLNTSYPNLVGTGAFVFGPDDATLAINVNADKTFTITAATAQNVDHYEIAIGTYVGVPGGSTRDYVFETLPANNLTSSIKMFNFIDYSWVENNPDATTGTLGGATTYTKAGNTYYLVSDSTYSTNGEVYKLCICSVSAYDANGNLLASTSYNFN